MDLAARARLRLALDMYEAGESMQRMRLKRVHPTVSDVEIEVLLRQWRHARPGADKGDSTGRQSHRFE